MKKYAEDNYKADDSTCKLCRKQIVMRIVKEIKDAAKTEPLTESKLNKMQEEWLK